MVLAQEGVVCGAKEGLAAARCYGTGKNKEEYSVCEAREHGCDAPEKDTQGGNPFAGVLVSKPAANGNHGGVEEVEEHCNKAHGLVCEGQAVPDKGQHAVEDLAVSLVQEIRHPKEQQDLPFVPLVVDFHAGSCYLWYTVVQKYEK